MDMRFYSKLILIIVVLLQLTSISLCAQQDTNQYKGTIKVKKKGDVVKVVFDNLNYRLVGIDRYGNVLDTAVVEYNVSVTVRGIYYTANITGSFLSSNITNALDRCDSPTKVYFDKIKVRNKEGILFDMPKFYYQLGYIDEGGY